jgi:hypothetical protein
MLDNGFGKGALLLEDMRIRSGTYQLKAYTKWSKNFGESYVFNKNITVFKDIENRISRSPQSGLDLQFFPEGGHLIDNVPSKIGFKAIGTNGLSRDVSGVIFNNMNDEQIEFTSVHNGMGVTHLTPLPGVRYTAVSEGIEYKLPQPLPHGIAMSVESVDHYYSVQINSTLQNPDSPLLLFAHVRGEVFYASLVIMEGGTGAAAVPKKNLSTGIVHFTVLDTSGNPASERLVFNKNQMDELNIAVELNSGSLSLRSEALLSLSIADFENSELNANASISVFDNGIVDFNSYRSNIFTHFNFESEIKGHIENPGFYFSDDDNAGHYLDILLMTQGWRAYDMSALRNPDQVKEFALPENGFTISGVIRRGILGKRAENASVLISVGREHSTMDIVTTDENGRFEITDVPVNDRQMITVRANDHRGSDRVSIHIDSQFSGLLYKYAPVPQLFVSATSKTGYNDPVISFQDRIENVHRELEQFVDFHMEAELDEITITDNRDMNNWMDDFIRQAGRAKSVDMTEREWMQSLPLEIVLSLLPGVRVNLIQGSISVTGGTASLTAPGGPIILLDGMYSDFSQLRNLPSSEVRTVRVLSGGPDLTLFGAQGANGVISVQTLKGYTLESRGLRTFYLDGYQLPKQFYFPRYGFTVPGNIEGVDSRVTLFWEPGLEVKAERNNSVRFYANDIPSEYRIVIEGVTETGLPFRHTQTFNVDE